MVSSKVEELENLLSRALRTVVIRRGQTDQVAYNYYQQSLQRCRAVYDPVRNLIVASCTPEIGQSALKDELNRFVCQELANCIRDGKIHSATYTFAGGVVGGSSFESVVQNLIRRAVVDGPAVASRAFFDCITNSECSLYRFFLLSGVRVDSVTEIFDGIILIPLPNEESQLPPYLPPIIDVPDGDDWPISIQHFRDKTLVRVEYKVSPIFHRPTEDYTFESGPETTL